MPEILHAITIDAPPKKVYDTIIEEEKIQGWWSHDTRTIPKVNEDLTVKFFGGQVTFKFKVDKLSHSKEIGWTPLDGGPPDWGNTQVTWKLREEDGKTHLLFGHHNFATTEGSLPHTSYTWAYYLTSLKDYIETGKGNPHTGS